MKRNDYTPLNIIERMNSKISLICSVAALIVLVLLFRLLDHQIIQKPVEEAQQAAEDEEAEANYAPQVTTASVIAVGDNLYHDALIAYGQSDDGTRNYEKVYEHVRPYIEAADLAIVDQETMLTTDSDIWGGYPTFATPTEVGDALVAVGFDVVEHATNHIDDHGYDYISGTLDYWKTKHPEITVLGIHESQEDADSIKIREVNGIKVGFLDYTYGTNNINNVGPAYMIDTFMDGSEHIASLVKKAKEEADCVVFVAHWGKEDEHMPDEYQKEWATFLMKAGVDVLIGGHPHVLQPYGVLDDEEGHHMVIFYSLGNFVSNQQDLAELLGGMACFTIQKTAYSDGTSSVEVKDIDVRPTVMHCDVYENVFAPYMLSDYTEELASNNTVSDYVGDIFTLSNLKKKFKEVMSIRVTPSDEETFLSYSINYNADFVDENGNVLPDNSITEMQYYGSMGIDVSSSMYTDEELDYTTDRTPGDGVAGEGDN